SRASAMLRTSPSPARFATVTCEGADPDGALMKALRPPPCAGRAAVPDRRDRVAKAAPHEWMRPAVRVDTVTSGLRRRAPPRHGRILTDKSFNLGPGRRIAGARGTGGCGTNRNTPCG